MNKLELIRELARKSFLNGSESKVVVNTIIKIISETLKSGEGVNMTGLGNFYLYEHKSRPVRNPKTNKPMMLSEFKSIKFKTSHALKQSIKDITINKQ